MLSDPVWGNHLTWSSMTLFSIRKCSVSWIVLAMLLRLLAEKMSKFRLYVNSSFTVYVTLKSWWDYLGQENFVLERRSSWRKGVFIDTEYPNASHFKEELGRLLFFCIVRVIGSQILMYDGAEDSHFTHTHPTSL